VTRRAGLDLDPARAYSYSALPWCLSAECMGGNWSMAAGEARAGGFDAARSVHRALGDHFAFAVAGGGALAQVQRGAVALVGVQADLAELGGGAKAQRQQAGGQRVQRAGVAALLGAQQPLAFCSASLLVQPSGLSSSSTPCRARRRLAGRGAAGPGPSVVLGPHGVGLGDQRRQVGGALGRAVEVEVQRRHGVDLTGA
jgi:hypothetical protein